jgi:hypothetical protein
VVNARNLGLETAPNAISAIPVPTPSHSGSPM